MKLSPYAGKPAEASIMVNAPKLVTAYYTDTPDPSVPEQRVAFGTSGHRGSAFDKAFNEWHILAIGQAICLYISGAVDGATRMQRLITDLLAFSRVGTREQTIEWTDLSKSLALAMEDLQVGIRESEAKITSDPLPKLKVDSTQIAQLFQNLIGNAIKFRSRHTPEIHIGAKQRQKEWLFSVKDNGIGISSQYAERIFMIFQRLHTRRKYPGTGIGLAICKKIVERHGGEIWVESSPEKGSTFYFSIPGQ